jgi:hypothetical protein
MMSTLHANQYTFLIVSRLILRRIKNVSDKFVEKIKSHVLCSVAFDSCAVYEITRKNIVEMGRPQMTIWRMPIACWMPKATNICSDYITLAAFHCNNGYMNAPRSYIVYTLPVLFIISNVET